MQQETVGARVARVRVVPGSGGREPWALGISTARLEPWGAAAPRGQVVWLRYRPATGWVLLGPPYDEQGRPANPVLSAFDLLPSGEGWAVGEDGVLLHKAAGYPICRIAYALMFDRLQAPYGGSTYPFGAARTSVDYLWTALGAAAQGRLAALDYAPLPRALLDTARAGVEAIRYTEF